MVYQRSFASQLRDVGFRVTGGSGFNLSIERRDFETRTRAQLQQDAIIITGAGVDAVVETTRKVKERIRSYIDAHFTGSALHGNDHRRVANASAQEKFYDDRAEKGQYTGLVYSKFGKRDRGGFTDFLALHIRGGTVKPVNDDWIKIPNKGVIGSLGVAQVTPRGYRSQFGTRIFMRPSKDRTKLFLLRDTGRRGGKSKSGIDLLATLVKSVEIPARLGGVPGIVRAGGVEMQGRLGQMLDQRLPRGGR